MSSVIDKIKCEIEPILTNLGYELVDINFVTQYGQKNLVIYIWKVGGITFDDCEKVNNAVEDTIDALDPSAGQPYNLNISSPGLDRPFKTQRDYERNYGEEVELKLYAPMKGKKYYEGVLKEKKENVVIITIGDEDVSFECNKVALVRPLVKFS